MCIKVNYTEFFRLLEKIENDFSFSHQRPRTYCHTQYIDPETQDLFFSSTIEFLYTQHLLQKQGSQICKIEISKILLVPSNKFRTTF